MKYFCNYEECVSAAYHKFCKGERKAGDGLGYDGSLMLHDDLLSGSGLDVIFKDCICGYDSYGSVCVMPDEWADVMWDAEKKGGMVAEIIAEATPWVSDAFEENGCFTILGI